MDLAAHTSPPKLFDALEGNNIDVLNNNAGFASYGPFATSNTANEMDMIQVNVTTLTHLTRLFLPQMIERGEGRIMNIASTAAFVPGPLMAVYYATKAYVLSFSEALAEELRGSGVTVTAYCPGPVATEFQERAKLARIADSFATGSWRSGPSPRKGYRAMMSGKVVAIPWIAEQARLSGGAFDPSLDPAKSSQEGSVPSGETLKTQAPGTIGFRTAARKGGGWRTT